MAKAERGPLSPERPELVQLSEIECCALARGFAKNSEAIGELMELTDKKTLKTAADILVRSRNLGFRHNKDIETAYQQIAAAELKKLNGDGASERWENEAKKCEHSLDEHKKALRAVVARLEKPTN